MRGGKRGQLRGVRVPVLLGADLGVATQRDQRLRVALLDRRRARLVESLAPGGRARGLVIDGEGPDLAIELGGLPGEFSLEAFPLGDGVEDAFPALKGVLLLGQAFADGLGIGQAIEGLAGRRQGQDHRRIAVGAIPDP